MLCTTTMWFIWTATGSKVFGNIIVHPVERVQNVWMQMVYTLKGWYDEIKGETMLQCCNVSNLSPIGRRSLFLHYKMLTYVVLSTTSMVVPTTNHITRLWNGGVLILFILYKWNPRRSATYQG